MLAAWRPVAGYGVRRDEGVERRCDGFKTWQQLPGFSTTAMRCFFCCYLCNTAKLLRGGLAGRASPARSALVRAEFTGELQQRATVLRFSKNAPHVVSQRAALQCGQPSGSSNGRLVCGAFVCSPGKEAAGTVNRLKVKCPCSFFFLSLSRHIASFLLLCCTIN